MAARFDSARLITLGMALSAVLTLLSPIAADLHFGWLIAVRVLIGMAHGPFNTCLYIMFSNWTPKSERSTALAGKTRALIAFATQWSKQWYSKKRSRALKFATFPSAVDADSEGFRV